MKIAFLEKIKIYKSKASLMKRGKKGSKIMQNKK